MVNPLQLLLDFFAPPDPPAKTSVAQATPMPVGEVSPLTFEVLHSPRRRTLGLEVHRDLRVVIRAPLACPEELVNRYVARHRRWIMRQLAQLQKLPPPRARPRYTENEAQLFQGRSYRLELQPQQRSKVALAEDVIVVGGIGASNSTTVESALARWYLARAKVEFPRMLARCHAHPRFARFPLPLLRIRSMRTRWGTMCVQRGMTLNTVLIQAPPECMEYVIFHELCHLSYRGHGARFYQLLTAVLPDWEARKRQLEATITW